MIFNPLRPLVMIRFLICCFFLTALSAQAQVKDTLAYARELAYSNKFAEAEDILTHYNRNETDVYGLWLQAQNAYWMGDPPKAIALYRKAYQMAPDLADLKLDYARILFNTGNLKEAKSILEDYESFQPAHPETQVMLGYLDLWSGKPGRARARVEKVLQESGENDLVNPLLKDIRILTAPYVTTGFNAFTDDQPLEFNEYKVGAGKYFSGLFAPFINAGTREFSVSGLDLQSYYVEAGNKFSAGIYGPEVILSVGLFKPDASKENTEVTGTLGVSQKIYNHFSLELTAARRPYQFTVASIRDPLMQTSAAAALSYNNIDRLIGKAAYERQFFPDDNVLTNAYIYALGAIVNKPVFHLDLGYSLSYSNSEENTFRPVEEISNLAGYSSQIPGIYDPYFSPQNQVVNSLLVSARIVPARFLTIKARGNYGFYAKADNPSLFATRNPGNNMRIEKFYSPLEYTPLELVGELEFNISEGFSLSTNYQFSRLFFYELHQVGLMAKYNFY